jgi:hypothetical protein
MVDDMMRPCVGADAILRHVASWGDRVPHGGKKSCYDRFVKRTGG